LSTHIKEDSLAESIGEPKKKLLYYLKVMQMAGLSELAEVRGTSSWPFRSRVWEGTAYDRKFLFIDNHRRMTWREFMSFQRRERKKMSETSDKLQQELLSWPGVTIHDHRFGGIEFRVNGREMGHLHGDKLADLPFPKDVGKKLIAEGKASLHHFIPQSGWISYYIKGIDDIPGAIELFQMQYERMTSYGKKKENNERLGKSNLTSSTTTTASLGEPMWNLLRNMNKLAGRAKRIHINLETYRRNG
jgi:hypothetical protein